MEVIAYKTDDFVCNKTPLKLVIETSFYAKYFEVVHRKNLPDIVLFYLNEPKSEKDRVWFLNPLIVQKQYLFARNIHPLYNRFLYKLELLLIHQKGVQTNCYLVIHQKQTHSTVRRRRH